jgi:hypothetical protein
VPAGRWDGIIGGAPLAGARDRRDRGVAEARAALFAGETTIAIVRGIAVSSANEATDTMPTRLTRRRWMNDQRDYDIRLDDKYGSLALIDLPSEIATHEPWFNQT